MNYATIKTADIANGNGVRVSLFVSGCSHHCLDCFNQEAWDFQYGEVFDRDVEDYIIKALAPSHIAGLTLLGGEPMEIAHQVALVGFIKRVKEIYPDKNIWCYTGYLFEDLRDGGRVYNEVTDELLSYIDVLVDGLFVKELKDITLRFKGSSNQRLIDVQQSLNKQTVVLYQDKDYYSKK